MLGTASLPHVLMRHFTTPSVRDARRSVAWSLLFIFILYFTAPAYAAFAKLEVYQNVIGVSMDTLPQWIRSEEHTSELQSLMRISYAVICLKKKNKYDKIITIYTKKNKS